MQREVPFRLHNSSEEEISKRHHLFLSSNFNLGSIQLRCDVTTWRRSVLRQTLSIERGDACVDVGRRCPVHLLTHRDQTLSPNMFLSAAVRSAVSHTVRLGYYFWFWVKV